MSPACTRTAILCAPIPCPALAITAVLYVLPADIAVNKSTPTFPPNTVVQPRCTESVALAAHVYLTRPLQNTPSGQLRVPKSDDSTHFLGDPSYTGQHVYAVSVTEEDSTSVLEQAVV